MSAIKKKKKKHILVPQLNDALLAPNSVLFYLWLLPLQLFGASSLAGSQGHDFFVRLLLYKALARGTA